MIPKILVVYGGHAGGRTEQLRLAIAEGVRGTGERVELREQPALSATDDDLLWADGILLATPEHFAYMSGALKDFSTERSTRSNRTRSVDLTAL